MTDQSTEPRENDMSAATLAVKSVALLNLAVHTAGVTQQELADRLGVSAGRVSQVLNGDGNMRVSTLARFLRAAGYDARLDAVPCSPTVEPLPRRKPRRRYSSGSGTFRYMVTQRTIVGTADGLEEQKVLQFSQCHPSEILGTVSPGIVEDIEVHTTFELPEVVKEPALRTAEVPLMREARIEHV